MRRVVKAILARCFLIPLVATALVAAFVGKGLHHVLKLFRGAPRRSEDGLHVVVIATFFNANWCRAHIAPIARCKNVSKVTAVVDGPTVALPKVEYVFPPAGLARVFGRILTKLIVLFSLAVRARPDVLVGYFIIPNALWALVIARLLGCGAIYQNTVGQTEIAGGGVATDNKVLSLLRRRSVVLERLVFAMVRQFDAVIVRGREGVEYLERRSLARLASAVVGSVDCRRFSPREAERQFDLITVARLVEIKQLDQLLEVVSLMRAKRPNVTANIVGEGPLREALEARARTLGIEGNVSFCGQVDEVENLLCQSKIFVLTSKMEGLSIALAEAMACGLPAVVADVGELSELVENGRTGWRIRPNDLNGYAERSLALLEDPSAWRRFSEAARRRAVDHNGLESVTGKWQSVLEAVVDDRLVGKMSVPVARI